MPDIEFIVGDKAGTIPAELAGLDQHSFLIHTEEDPARPGVRIIQLVGNSPVASRYAVWYFLMNYGDVRILGPEDFEELHESYADLPNGKFQIPENLRVIHPGPDFKLRMWTPLAANLATEALENGSFDIQFEPDEPTIIEGVQYLVPGWRQYLNGSGSANVEIVQRTELSVPPEQPQPHAIHVYGETEGVAGQTSTNPGDAGTWTLVNVPNRETYTLEFKYKTGGNVEQKNLVIAAQLDSDNTMILREEVAPSDDWVLWRRTIPIDIPGSAKGAPIAISIRLSLHGTVGRSNAEVWFDDVRLIFLRGQMIDPVAWLADTTNGSGNRIGTQRVLNFHNLWNIYPAPNGANCCSGWQPQFSDPDIVEPALEYATDVFNNYAHIDAISLGVNDGNGYHPDDIACCKSIGEDGRISVANAYYPYVNRVAQAVAAAYPNKGVTFFPYGYVDEPPTEPANFRLADNVIFFARNEPKIEYKRWQSVLPDTPQFGLGIKQWLYGPWYTLPNHYPHALQDMLRWAKDNGFEYYEAESYGSWSYDGPKMWVLANLLWDVEADVDALLDDYFGTAYGPGADSVQLFFERAEALYKRRPKKEDEYKFTVGAYHAAESYLNDLRRTPADLNYMCEKLDEAQQAVLGYDPTNDSNVCVDQTISVDGSAQSKWLKRLQRLGSAFEMGRAYGNAWLNMKELEVTNVASNEHVDTVLNLAKEHFEEKAKPREIWEHQAKNYVPWTGYRPHWENVGPRIRWSQVGLSEAMEHALTKVTKYKLEQGETVESVSDWWQAQISEISAAGELTETTRGELAAYMQQQRLYLAQPDAQLRDVAINGSFEEEHNPPSDYTDSSGTVWLVPHWEKYLNRIDEGDVHVTLSKEASKASDGNNSLVAWGPTEHGATGGYVGTLARMYVPNFRQYRLSFAYKTSTVMTDTKKARAVAHINTAKSGGGGYSSRYVLEPTLGDWRRFSVLVDTREEEAPDGHPSAILLLLALNNSESADDKVWFDDVQLTLLRPHPEPRQLDETVLPNPSFETQFGMGESNVINGAPHVVLDWQEYLNHAGDSAEVKVDTEHVAHGAYSLAASGETLDVEAPGYIGVMSYADVEKGRRYRLKLRYRSEGQDITATNISMSLFIETTMGALPLVNYLPPATDWNTFSTDFVVPIQDVPDNPWLRIILALRGTHGMPDAKLWLDDVQLMEVHPDTPLQSLTPTGNFEAELPNTAPECRMPISSPDVIMVAERNWECYLNRSVTGEVARIQLVNNDIVPDEGDAVFNHVIKVQGAGDYQGILKRFVNLPNELPPLPQKRLYRLWYRYKTDNVPR